MANEFDALVEATNREEGIEHLNALRHLVRSVGWKILSDYIANMIVVESSRIVQHPISDLVDLYRQEYAKGQIQSYRKLMQLPEELIDALETGIKEEPDDE